MKGGGVVVRIASLLLLLLRAAPSHAQRGALPDTAIRWHALRSAATGRDYRLIVSLPIGYAADDTTHYSVLYVLDGNDEFLRARSTQRILRATHEIPDLIVIGVGYSVGFSEDPTDRRWADYTPSSDSRADQAWETKLSNQLDASLRSGGGPRFLAALGTEIIPYVEKYYRATHDRALWGHSLGALFAVNALLAQPDLFTRYAISSPSLWWNDGDTFAREAEFARAHVALNARVFLSVGADEEPPMIEGVESLTRVLSSRRYEGFSMSAQTFKGANHATVVQGALTASLRFLYADVVKR